MNWLRKNLGMIAGNNKKIGNLTSNQVMATVNHFSIDHLFNRPKILTGRLAQ